MKREELIKQIRLKKSFLCVGLDPDIEKIPKHLVEDEDDPIYEFNKLIVDAVAAHCVAIKPNMAFYEAYGHSGHASLEKTVKYIKANYPELLVIADAKRGDIGNTSGMYAKAFFKRLNADAVTVTPYMGSDSVKPFLTFENKWAIILALTSNEGANDFELLEVNGKPLYRHVIEKCLTWGNPENMMFVIGANQTQVLKQIRQYLPDYFFLVPGVGAQGGDLREVCNAALTGDVGLLVNASRSIIYASGGKDFADKAGEEARKLAADMAQML